MTTFPICVFKKASTDQYGMDWHEAFAAVALDASAIAAVHIENPNAIDLPHFRQAKLCNLFWNTQIGKVVMSAPGRMVLWEIALPRSSAVPADSWG